MSADWQLVRVVRKDGTPVWSEVQNGSVDEATQLVEMYLAHGGSETEGLRAVAEPEPGITMRELVTLYPPRRCPYANPEELQECLGLKDIGKLWCEVPELLLWMGKAPFGRYYVWTWCGQHIVLRINEQPYTLPALERAWPELLTRFVTPPSDRVFATPDTRFPFNHHLIPEP
jgi:hypothetical protein